MTTELKFACKICKDELKANYGYCYDCRMTKTVECSDEHCKKRVLKPYKLCFEHNTKAQEAWKRKQALNIIH